MAQFVNVPQERLDAGVLSALLEDYTTRDGTYYGWRERTLEEKVKQLWRSWL